MFQASEIEERDRWPRIHHPGAIGAGPQGFDASELEIRKRSAVIAARRRYSLTRAPGYREERVRRIPRRSRIETRTKMATLTETQGMDVLQRLGDLVEEPLDENLICRLIQVSRGTVIIMDEESVGRFLHKLPEGQVIGVRRNLVEIAVTSPESIQETPGILTFLSSALSARGINIVQAMSCYTDTIFIVRHGDMVPVLDVLARNLAEDGTPRPIVG